MRHTVREREGMEKRKKHPGDFCIATSLSQSLCRGTRAGEYKGQPHLVGTDPLPTLQEERERERERKLPPHCCSLWRRALLLHTKGKRGEKVREGQTLPQRYTIPYHVGTHTHRHYHHKQQLIRACVPPSILYLPPFTHVQYSRRQKSCA